MAGVVLTVVEMAETLSIELRMPCKLEGMVAMKWPVRGMHGSGKQTKVLANHWQLNGFNFCFLFILLKNMTQPPYANSQPEAFTWVDGTSCMPVLTCAGLAVGETGKKPQPRSATVPRCSIHQSATASFNQIPGQNTLIHVHSY